MNSKFVAIITSTAIVAAASLGAKVLGLVRDRILASSFGAGDQLDIYYAAFRIPDFIFSVLVLGAIFAAFIPIYTEYLCKKDQEKAFLLTNSLINAILIGSTVVAIILFFLAPQLLQILTPGFTADKISQAADLMRIMLLSSVIFSVSGVLVSALQSHKKFVIFALAPMFYNAGIIFGAVCLVKWLGISGLAWGVVLGAFMQSVVQLPSMWKLGFRYRPVIDWKNSGALKVLKLMIPRAASLSLAQINILVETVLASMLTSGSLSILTLSYNLASAPVGILAVAIASVVFPTLAEKYSLQEKHEFSENFAFAMRNLMFLVMPLTAIIFLLRAQIVRLVLGAGQFDWDATTMTAQALGLYSISLFAQSMLPLLIRSFFAVQDTKTPLFVSIVSVVTNTVLAIFLSKWLGVSGLALTFTITSILQALILLLILRKKIGALGMHRVVVATGKFIIASIFMSFVIYGAIYGIEPFINTRTTFGLILQVTAATLAGILAYVGACALLSVEEIETIKGKWFRKTKS